MKINEFDRYSKKVVSFIECNSHTKRRIKEDIAELLYANYEETSNTNPKDIMGNPYDVAKEFSENLDKYIVSGEIYKSNITISGLPLVHITRCNNTTAKGIIAIGPKAIGVVSIGGISVGIISLGGLSIGLLSLGGLAIGLASIGGAAIAYDFAVGGLAIARNMAIGGFAMAESLAIGGASMAKLMGYSQTYIIPRTLDEGTAIAYEFPVYKQDLWDKFNRLFENFGFIKTQIIKLITK